ncbi:MAG: CRISPR-associated helicase Cas3' [Chloroflexi bacterium]|nr:CRISPR-associated helicase Cas3' [Chloroflexota bacterium]
MERASGKAARLLQIEALLLDYREGLTQAEIARRLGVDRSTIFRYQSDLGQFQVYETDDGRLAINRDGYLNHVRFTLHEALALHLAARLMATRMDRQNPHAAAALRKLGLALERLAPDISRHILASAEVMDTAAQHDDPLYVQVLEGLTRAWSDRRKVRIWHWHEQTGQVFAYIFSPYFIEPYAVGQTTHVIGLREPPGERRTFKIERIRRIERLAESYEIPPDFDPRRLLADAWGIWYTEAEPVEVVLKFHPRVVQRVKETTWHTSERREEPGDGSLVWRARIAAPQEMLPWIRGWGADVEVLEPAELRQTLKREARDLARLYHISSASQNATHARLLRCWGKTDRRKNEAHLFHPALFHMLDVGFVARELLGERASPRWRQVLGRALGVDPATLADWLPWFVGLHDIGKISPAFQGKNEAQKSRLIQEGFSFGNWAWKNDLPHSAISQVFAIDHGPAIPLPDLWNQAWHEATGGHHGRFIAPETFNPTRRRLKDEPSDWAAMRTEAAELLKAHLLRNTPHFPESVDISAATMALTGFTILCDWLGSDSDYFSLWPTDDIAEYVERSVQQARKRVEAAGFFQVTLSQTAVDFRSLFPDKLPPRPLQMAIDNIPADLLTEPCLAIIEAPTGEGKTEAALALAHRMAQTSGTEELYYALPTTATSNQMFGRVQEHIYRRLGMAATVKLVHGQAFLFEEELTLHPLSNGENGIDSAAAEWFRSNKKKALLAPFGVGTIDQVELAALNIPFVALRLVGLAGKVVILDEVHAYDTYMTTIVEQLLRWLSSLGASVILLSATLPLTRRLALMQAYGQAYGAAPGRDFLTSNAYPSLWVGHRAREYHATPPASQVDRHIEIRPLTFPDLESDGDQFEAQARWLVQAVAEGGCACWIANTVDRAQRIFQAVEALASPDVMRILLHARFPADDRQRLEQELTHMVGPKGTRPAKGIVVGTQVLEQSLDLDFDFMVSDLAPIDLLLQRAGRLDRHKNPPPVSHFWIYYAVDSQGAPQLGVNTLIYDEYILQRTLQTLDGRHTLHLPQDYRPLIEAVYGGPEPQPGDPLRPAWDKLRRKSNDALDQARQRLLPEPNPQWSICARVARLIFEENENSAAWIVAQTRLGEESLTVIPLEKSGNIARLWPGEDTVGLEAAAPREMEINLLRRSIRLSHHQAIAALRDSRTLLPLLFTGSVLLKECVPLWLEQGQAALPIEKGMVHFRLDPRLGLVITRQGENP